jgi:predicted nucleic acid-binding Zn ribbon protein
VVIKKSNESTLGEAIKELLKTYRLEDKYTETGIVHAWESVVGRMIAKYTKTLYVKNKKLFVKIENAAVVNELKFAREKIVKALNKNAGQEVITEIIFI